MAADEPGQFFGAAGSRGDVAYVKGLNGVAVFIGGAFAFDDCQDTGTGEVRLGRFEWVDVYASFVEASMAAFQFFGMGKKGVVPAFCAARWQE